MARFLIDEDDETIKLELKEAFRIYDRECRGFITTGDLREILVELDPGLGGEQVQGAGSHLGLQVDGIVEEVDQDRSGTVDFGEFLAMMTG